MAESGFTAEEFETWIPAPDAFRRADKTLGPLAAYTLVQRLHSGLLVGRAKNLFIEPSAKRVDHGFSQVISDLVWKELLDQQHLYNHPLWQSADFSVRIYQYDRSITVRMFGVRFDPDGIREILPPPPPPKGLIGSSLPPQQTEEPTGGPVPTAHLKDWYELYKVVTPQNEQTEDHAWKSALGMFPGKSVTRAKIRALRGAGALKRGPKPRENQY